MPPSARPTGEVFGSDLVKQINKGQRRIGGLARAALYGFVRGTASAMGGCVVSALVWWVQTRH